MGTDHRHRAGLGEAGGELTLVPVGRRGEFLTPMRGDDHAIGHAQGQQDLDQLGRLRIVAQQDQRLRVGQAVGVMGAGDPADAMATDLGDNRPVEQVAGFGPGAGRLHAEVAQQVVGRPQSDGAPVHGVVVGGAGHVESGRGQRRPDDRRRIDQRITAIDPLVGPEGGVGDELAVGGDALRHRALQVEIGDVRRGDPRLHRPPQRAIAVRVAIALSLDPVVQQHVADPPRP